MVIALLNNKGGVAKTTTAVNLAAALALSGRRVLLCDLDSQGSASLSLGIPRAELEPSAADVLLDGLPIGRAIRATKLEGLELLTGSMGLANADLALADVRGRERRLAAALAPVRTAYDFVLLDCPPSLSLVPVNALVAADRIIIPVSPQYLALEGLVNLMEAIDRIREGIGAGADVMGLLLTMVDYRTRAAGEIAAMMRQHYGRLVFRTEIRTSVKLSEAPSFGETIFDYGASSAGAEAYQALAAEVLQRSRKDGKTEGRKAGNKETR